MERKSECIPAMFRKEHPIEIRDDVSFSAFSSDGEAGIMLVPGEADLDVKADEVAFLFGSDKNDLYFRPQFGLFVKVEFDPDEEAAVSKLYNARIGVYKNCSLIKDVRFNVPIYRNALDMIDIHKEDEVEDAGEGDAIVDPLPIKSMIFDDEETDDEIEKEVGEHLETTEETYAEIKDAVDKEVERYNGQVLARYRPGNNRIFSPDFVKIGKKYYIIVYAEFVGYWLAEEEALAGEPPQWYSEKTQNNVSPVFQASECRSFFSKELPQLNIESIVVLPEKCIVINDEEMQGHWRKTCGTDVVRSKRIAETCLVTLGQHIDSMPVEDSEVTELDAIDLIGILNRFIEEWINKTE